MKIIVQTEVSEGEIKEICGLQGEEYRQEYPEIAKNLVEHILNRYFYKEYFNEDDITDFLLGLEEKRPK